MMVGGAVLGSRPRIALLSYAKGTCEWGCCVMQDGVVVISIGEHSDGTENWSMMLIKCQAYAKAHRMIVELRIMYYRRKT